MCACPKIRIVAVACVLLMAARLAANFQRLVIDKRERAMIDMPQLFKKELALCVLLRRFVRLLLHV